jgi:hypothetical protein
MQIHVLPVTLSLKHCKYTYIHGKQGLKMELLILLIINYLY